MLLYFFLLALKCSICNRTFTRVDNLKRHEKGHTKEKAFKCTKCDKAFSRKEDKTRHEKNCKRRRDDDQEEPCGSGIHHPKRPRTETQSQTDFTIRKVKSAFRNATVTWKLRYGANCGSMDLIDPSVKTMASYLQHYREKELALKFHMSLHVNFEQATDPSIVTVPPAVLVSEQFEVYADTDIDDILLEVAKQLKNRVEVYEGTGSGWVISNLVVLDTTVWKLDPLRASTYHQLSTWIRNTKCVVNVQNKDKLCLSTRSWLVCTSHHHQLM